MIKVSIIIPVYNQEELVIRALDSIPDRDDVEVLVINDGSTDHTWENLTSYKRLKNLKLFNNEKNLDIGLSRNVGFDNATGHWLYALDSDDYFYTNEFNAVVDYLDNLEEYDIVHVHFQCNDGSYLRHNKMCGFPTFFVKRETLGDLRCPYDHPEDLPVLNEMRRRGVKEVTISNPVFYHYNYPRVGSVTDLISKGIIKSN